MCALRAAVGLLCRSWRLQRLALRVRLWAICHCIVSGKNIVGEDKKSVLYVVRM